MSPPNFYFSEPLMSLGNIKYVSKTSGHALHSADIPFLTSQQHSTEKKLQKLGIFKEKHGLRSLFAKPLAISVVF